MEANVDSCVRGFHVYQDLWIGMGLFCFYFHLFFFPAILFFQPIMLNILLQAIYYAQDFAQYLRSYL